MSLFSARTVALLTLLSCIALLPAANAATITPYSDEASFLTAIGPTYTRADFDGFPSGTLLVSQVPGVTFSSPLAGYEGYFPIQAFASPGSISEPNSLAGGFVSGSPDLAQTIGLEFSPHTRAFGFYLSPLTPNSIVVSVRVDFLDQTSQTLQVSDRDSNGTEFLGLVSDTGISRISFESDKQQGGQEGFKQFGLDDLLFVTADMNLPVCTTQKAIVDGVLGFNGTSTDNGSFDGGISSVTLVDATNVTLTCDTPFHASCGSIAMPAPVATWRIVPTDPLQGGEGRVLAIDAAGNSCSVSLTFTSFAGGPVVDLQVCSAPGISLEASNPGSSSGGQIVCGSNLPGPGDPGFPPGYEPSLADDAFPCTISTIRSPISGLTVMVLEKDGDFEPRLRLLYSRFDGMTFSPFTDITDSVEEIATVIPDPTRVKGSANWSQVKVACAVLAETCNGIDDDGDGLTDEGFPVGGPAIDCDADGHPLCATAETTALSCAGEIVTIAPGATVDCNDQIPSIHTGAEERCNGMDDDCDGAIDEEIAPVSCGVGACARTIEACVDHVPQTCVPGAPGTESCNGLDDDCDGVTDEDLGQTTCGSGVCARTVDNCAAGAAQTCTPGDPGTESCNSLDDDCDGATDEDFGQTTCGSGVCEITVDNCVGGVPQTCVPVEAGTEICNGFDDDCDGSIDETLTFSGYLQPVNDDGSSIFQAGRTVPFKFRLSDCSGDIPPPVTATIEVIFQANGIAGTVLETVSSSLKASAGIAYVYDARTNQYHYNLGTKGLRSNATYLVRTTILEDGSVHDVVISLK